MARLKMKTVWPLTLTTATTDGVFSYIFPSGRTAPWAAKTYIGSDQLNIQYHLLHSGGKTTSPLLDMLSESHDDGLLTTAEKTQLGNIIYQNYIDKWDRLYDVFVAEYTATDNYNMSELVSETHTNTGTQSNSGSTTYGETITTDRDETNTGTQRDSGSTVHGHVIETDQDESNTGTQGTSGTTTYGHTQTETGSSSGTQNASIYGFDSEDDVPANKNTNTASTSNSTTEGGSDGNSSTRTDNLAHTNDVTETHSGTDTNSNTRTDNLTHTDDITEEHSGSDSHTNTMTNNLRSTDNLTRTRHGNIGVTTTQEMLASEIKLWEWGFFDSVFADIDKILTTGVY